VAYRDATQRDLKLAIGRPSGDAFTWTSQVIDGMGDVGLWNNLSIGPDGLPAVAYMAPASQTDTSVAAATSGLRWAQASGDLNAGLTWTFTDLDTRADRFDCNGGCATAEKCRTDTNVCARSLSASRCNDACGAGEGCFEDGCAPLAETSAIQDLPETVGLYARLARFSNGDAAIVYYDRVGGDLRYIRQQGGVWGRPRHPRRARRGRHRHHRRRAVLRPGHRPPGSRPHQLCGRRQGRPPLPRPGDDDQHHRR
jgi:hypothetical protein